ncbi:acyl-CoA dehydrogenase family protein [Haladaptatus sp. DJG-WS-42]|uniref:acyl-CoA dehydrogenase family protein n=1 Tax=Haladaptatus sp. DJG-WS-42 TaxID=3120516 RepID=UPI0030D0985A
MELTPEQQAIKEAVREFSINEIRPTAEQADREQVFPEEVWQGLADLDLLGLNIPEEYGGFGGDRMTYSIVNEEVAYGMLAAATAMSVQYLVNACIDEFGSDAHREHWLPRLASGESIGAFCLSEPGAGSNPAQMETEAKRVGDEYVLNGKKQWITNGQRSDVAVVFAKTDREDPRTVTQFLVPKDTPGVEVGKKEDKLGLRASDTTGLIFDDVHIPAENRLTEVGKGLSAAFSILNGGRIAIASQAVGVGQSALDEALSYAQEREQFGEPIAEIQTIQHKLADMQTKVQAARLLARDAARRDDAGEDVQMAASIAKYFASENAVQVANQAVQIHGGYGYTTDFPVERMYRDAKITTIYEGTSEIQKMVIARNLLG